MAPARKGFSFHLLRYAAAMASLLAFSCSFLDSKPTLLWTDTPEILIAAEMFNASRSRQLIEVHYVENLAGTLRRPVEEGGTVPSIVIGKGLRTKALDRYFQSAENVFGELVLPKDTFYPALLEGGKEGSRQVLIPVSFNLMLVMGRKESTRPSGMAELDLPPANSGAITMEEIQRRAVLFNGITKESGERMGFSPRWPDRELLYQWIQLTGADFGEARTAQDRKNSNGEAFPVTWNPGGLENAAALLRAYVRDVNGSVAAEDAFAFKYLFAPGYKNVEAGKVLFAAMDSAAYFTLPPVARSRYEYRYFSEKERLAVLEDIRYAGIPRRAPNKETARQFLRWLFNPGHQKDILEKSRGLRISESAFGVAGGFSSIKSVTEDVFPSYYTDLLGHIPPEDMVLPPRAFPDSWEKIKAEVILPWLDEIAGKEAEPAANAELFSPMKAYLDRNPDFRP